LRRASQNEEEVNHMVSSAQLQEIPPKSMILLVGAPGSGKSTFCQQAALKSLAMDRPIIYVTTEYGPSDAERTLREQGLHEAEPGVLNFVDAYNETVGVSVSDRPDTVYADCNDLSSIDIAISKLQERIRKKGALLVFDSLTSPYLFSGSEILRFIRQTLSRFAASGNSVLGCIDEGCGKSEDVVAMMTLSSGVIRMELREGKKVLNVVKHPRIEPTEIEVPVTVRPRVICSYYDTEYMKKEAEMALRGVKVTLRPTVGDYINIAWRDLIFWSGALWDPKRFPTMMYELSKYSEDPTNYDFDMVSLFPWHKRLLLKLFFPKSFSKVKDMRKVFERAFKPQYTQWRISTVKYLDDISKTDEHYIRGYEHYECWGFENVGASLGIMKTALMAGSLKGMEELFGGTERDWNAVETKCIGRGDPYCEVKFVPGEIEELKDPLEKDSSVIERINNRLMEHLMGFLLHRKPLMERPTWGSGVHIHEIQHVTAAPLVNERLQMVFSMGGARAGKMLGERLLEAGLKEEEAVKRVVDLMEHCKVGKVTFGETIRMRENCERFGIKTEHPSCYFTTGFLNGFFSAVKNNHVKETKCIAMGDPYCEWEFR
jgi:predicted hydrocarbon binding protein/KaiC/GvpD/RAD55 family RecA-like ATPase